MRKLKSCLIVALTAFMLTPVYAQESASNPVPKPSGALDPASFPESAYITVSPDGHLRQNGRRVRYWGFIGFVSGGGAGLTPGDSATVRQEKVKKRRADVDLSVRRIADDLGFNMIRSWEGMFDTGLRGMPVLLSEHEYTPGDGSHSDLLAYYLWRLDQKGVKVWLSALNTLGPVQPEDAGVIADAATESAWKAAVAELTQKNGGSPADLRGLPCRIWDPRVEALAIERYRQGATWPNRYKGGLRLCDDPQVGVWEISNEELALQALFNGAWQDQPAFFRNELLTKWTTFLKAKYGTEEKMRAAWGGLLTGESLEAGTVLLAPLAGPARPDAAVNDTNPEAAARLLHTAKSGYTRDDFTRARGADVVEFFTGLVMAHKKRFADAIKGMGRSCRLSPCVWDTGVTYQIQSQYVLAHGDAVAVCSYTSNMGYDPKDRRFPFHSALEAPPRLCWDVPWLEQGAVVGKPLFLYEVQTKNQSKYRAEFPLQVAALAGIEDWDIINWHAYGQGADSSRKEPFAGALMIGHDFFGYATDEVQLSAMRAAGESFKNGLLSPPSKPTVFTFGRKSLYDPASMEYGRSYGDLGKRFLPTAYRYGMRVKINPDQEEDAIDGPSLREGVYESCPVRPTDQIEYDWRRGHLKLDAPGIASYTGFLAQFGQPTVTFSASDTVFEKVTIVNPPGMPYPVAPDEKYVAVTLTSADGLPLAKTRRAVLSAVSTSFNTGFKLDTTRSLRGRLQEGPGEGPPQEYSGAWVADPGREPVLVARVGVTIRSPGLRGMRYTFRDWQMRPLRSGIVGPSEVLTIPASLPVFFVVLER